MTSYTKYHQEYAEKQKFLRRWNKFELDELDTLEFLLRDNIESQQLSIEAYKHPEDRYSRLIEKCEFQLEIMVTMLEQINAAKRVKRGLEI